MFNVKSHHSTALHILFHNLSY